MFIVPNDSLGSQVRQNLLQPLDDIAANYDMSVFSPLSVEGCRVDGKLYCIPESLKAVGLYYDKSKIATPPATTDALLAGVTDGSIKLGVNGRYHASASGAYGGKLWTTRACCRPGGVADAHAVPGSQDGRGQLVRRQQLREGRRRVQAGPEQRLR
jgi:maltose-binding protein MalE